MKDPKKLIRAWSAYVEEQAACGKRIYLMSLMFKPMNGSRGTLRMRMHAETDRVYAILVSHMFHRPRAKAVKPQLPIFLVSLDQPVFKRTPQTHLGDVRINDGIHLHGIGIMPKRSRLGCGLQRHFKTNQKLYVRGSSKLARIHAVRAKHDLAGVSDYALKGLKRSRDPDDDWIILPKSANELKKRRGGS